MFVWSLFDTYVDPILKFIAERGREAVPSVEVNRVTTLMWLFESLTQVSGGSGGMNLRE